MEVANPTEGDSKVKYLYINHDSTHGNYEARQSLRVKSQRS